MRAVTFRRILVPLSAAALLCGAAACGGGGDEVAGPTATPTVAASTPASPIPTESAEATASPAVPDVPKPDPADYPGMDQHTDEGAAQAYRYFWATMLWGYQTGESAPMAEISGPACSSCEENLDSIRALSARGEFWSVSSFTDQHISTIPSSKNEIEVIYVVDLGPHTEPDETTWETLTLDEVRYSSVGGLDWVDGAWEVSHFAIRSGSDTGQ